jgi:serine/threonine protein kinase/tetratricopeptide (TPR) repeat protein
MSADAQKARSIFLAAVEQYAPDQWEAYLQQACAGDEVLRRRVDVLLRAHQQPNSLLDCRATDLAGTVDEPPAAEGPGTVVGPYKLMEQIGEGGMGLVFVAEQQHPVRRKVALKVIKPGMDTRQVIARFEAERQALALMDHPNIAKVHDGGETASGRPYFVMELVKGVSITGYCDQNQVPIRDRLELFLHVCQAVQHAHQKGIIHRDIKPSNVLVMSQDGTPLVKVIDFGVAKAIGQQLTDKTIYTQFTQLLGTPLYMSPEQAGQSSLDVDTRSDIYSLGVLLYELLTGTTPFDKGRFKELGYDEMRRIIREEEPPKPSTRLSTLGQVATAISAQRRSDPRKLRQLFRRELDWIVMKCLEKDRGRRYETGNALAMDVQRYLHDEPVQAFPPSAGYRLRKFARRNGRWLVAAGLVGASLLLGTAISLWLAVRATRAEAETRQRMVAEEKARRQATAINDFLLTMLRSANPEDVRGADYTVRQLLDEFSIGLTEQQRFRDQPEVEAEIQATMGRAYRRLGISEKAERHLQAALDLRRRVFAPDDEKVAESLVDYAWGCYQQGHYSEAEAHAREAQAIYRKRSSPPGRVISALGSLVRALMEQERLEEAEATAEEALALAAQSPDALYPEIASILHAVAEGKRRRAQYAEAETWARKALALHRRAHGDEHIETAWCLLELGRDLHQRKELPEAEACLREALANFRRHYPGSDHKSVRGVLYCLKAVLQERGAQAELAALEREFPVPSTESLGKYDADAKLWLDRMTKYGQAKQWSEALAAMRRAVVFNESGEGAWQRPLGVECKRLAEALLQEGQGALAEEPARNAVALLQDRVGKQ